MVFNNRPTEREREREKEREREREREQKKMAASKRACFKFVPRAENFFGQRKRVKLYYTG
jgi:hypothetical protein